MLMALFASVSAVAADWYLSGASTGWGHAGNDTYKFVASETAGVLKIKDPIPEFTGDFLVVAGTNGVADWNNKYASNGSKLKNGVPYKLSKGASNNASTDDVIKNAVVTLEESTMTLTITGQDSENEYTDIYLIGDFGGGWSETATDKPLKLKDGTENTYTGTYTLEAETSYFKMKAGSFVYGTGGDDIAVALGTTYTASKSGNAFSIPAGSYDFTYVLEKNADTGKLTVTGQGVAPDMTIYWDNTEAKWASVYAYIETDEARSEFEPYPGVQLDPVSGAENIYSLLIPGNYTKVTFNDGTQGNKSDVYTAQDKYIYSLTNSGKPYTEPVDYTGYYVNVLGDFNGWGDNGITPSSEGLTSHTVKNVGDTGFKIKVWNGTAEEWYSTGSELPLDQWVSCASNSDNNMTVPASVRSGDLQVDYNYAAKQIRISVPEAPDYTTWSVSFFGDFNDWDLQCGVVPSAEGIAEATVSNVNTAFKVKVWDGKADTYYSNGEEIVMNQWTTIVGNVDPGMTLPAANQSGSVTMSFNLVTNELMVKNYNGIDSVSADNGADAVYYNLQGVQVETPQNGLYIVKRGDKVTKEVIR